MLPQVPPGKFPWKPLWVRYAFKTEQVLSSLPVVIVTPVFGAVAAAAVAAKAPTLEVVRNGVVVDQSSYLHVFGAAAIGALAGIMLAILLAFSWHVWIYRRRTDSSWATRWDLNVSQLRDLTESAWRQKQTLIMPTVLLISETFPLLRLRTVPILTGARDRRFRSSPSSTAHGSTREKVRQTNGELSPLLQRAIALVVDSIQINR